MRVGELLDVPDLGRRLLTDVTGMNRAMTGRDLSRLDDQVDFFLALRVR